MKPSRRGLIAAPILAAGLAGAAEARPARGTGTETAPLTPMQAALDAPDPSEVINLWPGAAPGHPPGMVAEEVLPRSPPDGMRDRAVIHVAKPTLTVFRPRASNGAGVLIIPGGGYARVVVDKEGFETARYLAARGYTAFVLRYRLPGDRWAAGPDASLQDAQRAIRLIRAGQYGISDDRIAVIGFSAGGHVAGSLAARASDQTYAPIDAADAQTIAPRALCLMYPVISMREDIAYAGLRDQFAGAAPLETYSVEARVSAAMPQTLLMHSADDTTVPVANSVVMFQALKAANVAGELHIFETGSHGFGMRFLEGKSAAAWPELFLAWLKRHGI